MIGYACPCGFLTDAKKACHCTPPMVQKYLSRVSGPLLDRIDIHLEVSGVNYKDLSGEIIEEKSDIIKERVQKAREIQLKRFKDDQIFSNSNMNHRLVRKYCGLDKPGRELLKTAITELGFSARCYDKILKLSRTIADLEGKERIDPNHVSEAIQYRSLDRL